ncbi:MAG: HAD hydrolase family protein [Oligoflexales bacterium]
MRIALIPLRLGSKSIIKKNIKPIHGKPLFYWTCKAALDARNVDEVWVSTESDEIAAEVHKWLPEIYIHKRPIELADDTESTENVMIDFAKSHPFDYFFLLQATSPLTTSLDIDACYSTLKEEKSDSVLTVTEFKRFLWTQEQKPLNYNPHDRPRRQDFQGYAMENGAIYLTTSQAFQQSQTRISGRISLHYMHPNTAFEIDEPEDWFIVENLLQRQEKNKENHTKVQAIVCDVDGTLTDGMMIYSGQGELGKSFYSRDWRGLSQLRQAGIKVMILTGEESPAVRARVEKLGYQELYFSGIDNKKPFLEEKLQAMGLGFQDIAYIGDDDNDLECLQKAGWSACPRDAHPSVQKSVHYVCKQKGGFGAVREFCDHILQNLTKNVKP